MSLHVGDTAPRYTGTLTSDGAPVNLAGATIRLHFRKPNRDVLEMDATPDGDPTLGKVIGAAWGAGDVDQAGAWTVETEVTYSDATQQTFGPDAFYVERQIA